MSSTVPQSVLLQRKAKKQAKDLKTEEANVNTVKQAAKAKEYFKRAEKYVAEYKAKQRDETRLRRLAESQGKFYIPEETKVVFVVRILGTYGVAPKVRKILQLLRLLQQNNGTFVRVNKATTNMLIQISPYVTWGSVSVETARKLIYKRGFGRVNGQRIPLSDNAIIEKALGKYNIICVEDLVHEIVTCGPHFKEANSFLWTFKLNSPVTGFVAKKIGFNEGGDAGDRKDMNSFLAKMI